MAVAASAKVENAEKWKVKDHVRYMFMLMTWVAVWVLRVLTDYFPCSIGPSSLPYPLLEGFSTVGSLDMVPSSSSSSSLDLILHESYAMAIPPGKALGRALSHVLAIVNEIPATSRKYQFAVAMADRIVDDNTRDGHIELLEINRLALASAFARTSSLLHSALESSHKASDDYSAWGTRVLSSLPFGSFLAPYVVKGLGAVFSLASGSKSQKQRQMVLGGRERVDDVAAEKHAQELLWIADKMRGCGAVDEALVLWSLSSDLASLALNANPRVQGIILKISALLIGDLSGAKMEVPRQVTFRLLVLWLPLFCYAENGIAYPVLTRYEKAQMERIMDDLISTLPAMDQQVILTNWLQDFSISTSEWPNLQLSYDRWCQSTRNLIAENLEYKDN